DQCESDKGRFEDRLSVHDLCHVDRPGGDAIFCSSNVVRALVEADSTGNQLLFILAHELGHIVEKTSGSFLRFAEVPAAGPLAQRIPDLGNHACPVQDANALERERRADEFAARLMGMGNAFSEAETAGFGTTHPMIRIGGSGCPAALNTFQAYTKI